MLAQIQTIERNYFDDLQSLVELNLAHNNLTFLPHDLFKPLHCLEQFYLHHNILLLPFSSQNTVGTCMLLRLTKQHLGTQKELCGWCTDLQTPSTDLTYNYTFVFKLCQGNLTAWVFCGFGSAVVAPLILVFCHENKSCCNSSVKGWICTNLTHFVTVLGRTDFHVNIWLES